MDDVEGGRLHLHHVFGPSLDASKIWYSIPNQLMSNGRKEDFIDSDVGKFFPDEIQEVPIEELRTDDGERAHFYMFGSSRKKDLVVVATMFGLLSRSLRRKNLGSDKFLKSREFIQLKKSINAFDFEHTILAGKNGAELPLIGTPPETPEENLCSVPDVKDSKIPEIESLGKIRESDIGPRLKAKKAGKVTKSLIEGIKKSLHADDDLGILLGYTFVYGEEEEKDFVRNALSSALSLVAEKMGFKKALQIMLNESVYNGFIDTMKVPDWVQLFVKLCTKMTDKSWQTMLNFLNLGKTGKASDAGILLSSNEIRAKKALVFDITRNMFNISLLPYELRGYSVSLPMVLIWAIRESRLHQSAPEHIEFNLKLDGRPLAGRNQVSIGVVPTSLAVAIKGCQSALSVYPLAIANCKEEREKTKTLLKRLNEEKKMIKENGLLVDGNIYKIKFKVTLDLKALLMLMVDPDDEDFVLGGRGLEVQFCVFCDTLRACKEHWNGAYDEVCLTCLQSKANIGNWTGFRDDLSFLFDEELSNIPLCSLHCEMRNTEQLFGSLGLFAFKCGCLDECNRAIANYGPENSWGYDRIQIKPREGQQTAITKSNVKVSSFSGSTAKAFLVNSDEIVAQSLPMDNVITYYKQVSGAAKDVVLGFVSFLDSVKD